MTADQLKSISRTNSSNATTSNTTNNNINLHSNLHSNRDPSPDRLKKMKLNWPGRHEFLKAQAVIAGILWLAAFGNKWEPSYDRNENHDMFTFWLMNGLILAVGIYTLKHDANGSARGVQLLSRPQTEEWKGWMQWAFIMVRDVRLQDVALRYTRVICDQRKTKSDLILLLTFIHAPLLLPTKSNKHSITTIGPTMCTMSFVSLYPPMSG
jgi:hypothetical protein